MKSHYLLPDVLDMVTLQTMAVSNYKASGMPIGIIDAINKSVIVGAGWQDICVKFHRIHPDTLEQCRHSDDVIKNSLVRGEACQYKCKNGLWDIGIPILAEERHLATLFLGQFFYENELPDRAFFIQQAQRYGFDTTAYLSALDRVPVFSKEKVAFILEYNKALAAFIGELAEQANRKKVADEKLKFAHMVLDLQKEMSGDGILLVDKAGQIILHNQRLTQIWDIAEETMATGSEQLVIQSILSKLASPNEFIDHSNYLHTHWHEKSFDEITLIDGRTLERFSAPMIGDNDLYHGRLWHYRDITERKKSEKSLRDNLTFLQTLIDTIPNPIFYKSLSGRYLGANRAFCKKIIGLPVEQILNRTVYDFPANIPKGMADTYHMSDLALIEKGEAQVYESAVKCADGKIRQFIFNKAVFSDAAENPAGLVGAMVDITDRNKAEDEKRLMQGQLRQLQKIEAIGTLAGGIAHDFNNILFPLIGYAEMLRDDLPAGSPQEGPVNGILAASIRAKELVRQILAFGRQAEKDVKPLDIRSIIMEVLKLIRSSLPSTIMIQQTINEDCHLILADQTHIHQIVMNVITNAYHAMETVGGTLTITLKNFEPGGRIDDLSDWSNGPYVMLSISDTGVGMEEETLAKVFDPYYTTKPQGKGTGLGLSVVHGIVKSYHGEIRIDSKPGKGTVFNIYLPALVSQKTQSDSFKTEPAPTGNENILLVDDEESIVLMEKEMLERLGYHVTSRTSSIEALEVVKASPERFALIISDMTMPGLTGLELLREIRKINPKIPWIISTGFSEQINKDKCASLGIKGFVMKPVLMHEIARTIRNVLD